MRKEKDKNNQAVMKKGGKEKQKTPDKNMGSIITVTGTFGLAAANHTIKYIINSKS